MFNIPKILLVRCRRRSVATKSSLFFRGGRAFWLLEKNDTYSLNTSNFAGKQNEQNKIKSERSKVTSNG